MSYNEFWFERGIELTADKRTSLVVDPPDRKLPPRTAEAQRAARERAAYQDEHRYDSHESRSLAERCIMGFNSGPPMRSSAYNNNVMVFQAPGYVVILNEMVHNARVIPLDDTAKPMFSQFTGVSRGHWEGETLVVETTQFRGGQSGGTGPNMHLTERFTRLDPETVVYDFTVTDPTVYTAPYTVMMPFRRTDWPALRVCVSRGQLRTLRNSRRGAESRTARTRATSLTSARTIETVAAATDRRRRWKPPAGCDASTRSRSNSQGRANTNIVFPALGRISGVRLVNADAVPALPVLTATYCRPSTA